MNLYSNSGSIWKPGILKRYLALLLLQLLCTSGLFAQAIKQKKTISLTYKEVSASVLFKALKQQTGYDFNFSPADVDHVKIGPLEYKTTPLDKVLKDLGQYGLSFHQAGNIISVSYQKPASKSPNVAAGQGPGTLKGRIVEFETSQPLPGASVYILELKKGAQSNNDGYYKFNNVPAGKYTLKVSFISYKTESVQVEVKGGKEETFDVKMQGSNALQEVVVSSVRKSRAPVAHTTERQMLEEVKQSSLVVSAISSQQISRSADRNAAEVMQRIGGVTTVDDKFVIVRGLNQRYSLTYLNDNVAPSTEIYSRAFALDLIPSRIIDKILVYKSPSPENQGDATGGVIKIYTKDAKTVKHFDIEVQSGYRAGTTFNKNFLTYQGGKFDFLGFDDGTRKLPSAVPGYTNLDKAKISQTEYVRSFSPVLSYGRKTALPNLQLTANYYNSFKFFGKNLSSLSSLSYKNERQHAEVYRQQGFGADVDRISNEDRNNETAQLNLLQNFSFKLKDSSTIQFKNFLLQQGVNTTLTRISYPTILAYGIQPTPIQFNTLNKDNILSFTQRFLYAGNFGGNHFWGKGKQKLQWNTGYTFSKQSTPDQRVIRFTGPRALAVPGDTTFQWKARGMQGGREESDVMGGTFGIMTRFWTKMQEGVYNASADYNYKYKPWLTFKVGMFQQWKERKLFRKVFNVHEGDFVENVYNASPGSHGTYVDPNLVRFTEQQLPYVWSTDYFREDGSGLKVIDKTVGSDAYVATEQNNSGYAAFAFTPDNRKFELYGGMRVEYNRQKIGAAIPARVVTGNDGNISVPVLVDNPTTNFLPSLNGSYRPNESWVIRAAYGKTLNRYEFREASPYSEIDYENNLTIYGNPKLKTARVDNYDLRVEFYPSNNSKGELISVGIFYKDLKDPIERITATSRSRDVSIPTITYRNAHSAILKGLEIEVQKKMDFIDGKVFRDITILGNVSLIKSEALLYNSVYTPDTIRRPLQGQAPYIINAGVNYENAGLGAKLSVNYNIVGTRIYAAGIGKVKNDFVGNLYAGSLMELPRHSLDIAYTQRLYKSMQLKVGVQNVLNQAVKMAEDHNYSWKYEPAYKDPDPLPGAVMPMLGDNIASSFNPGRYFVITFSYSL